jgi:hypothetical protein
LIPVWSFLVFFFFFAVVSNIIFMHISVYQKGS